MIDEGLLALGTLPYHRIRTTAAAAAPAAVGQVQVRPALETHVLVAPGTDDVIASGILRYRDAAVTARFDRRPSSSSSSRRTTGTSGSPLRFLLLLL